MEFRKSLVVVLCDQANACNPHISHRRTNIDEYSSEEVSQHWSLHDNVKFQGKLSIYNWFITLGLWWDEIQAELLCQRKWGNDAQQCTCQVSKLLKNWMCQCIYHVMWWCLKIEFFHHISGITSSISCVLLYHTPSTAVFCGILQHVHVSSHEPWLLLLIPPKHPPGRSKSLCYIRTVFF